MHARCVSHRIDLIARSIESLNPIQRLNGYGYTHAAGLAYGSAIDRVR